jgi:hypothetical protein
VSILRRMRIGSIFLTGVVALASATGVSSQNQEDRWQDYEPRTLQSIIDMHRADAARLNSHKLAMLLSAWNFPSQVKLVYLGDSRPISGKRKYLLEDWKKMMKDVMPSDSSDLYPTEILFKEGSHVHWIVIQKPLLDFLPKEAKRGQVINAYVVWMGAVKIDTHWEWLFGMNDFDASYCETTCKPGSR